MKIRTGMLWSEDFKNWVAEHFLGGMSASEVATLARKQFADQDCGLTRNAVIGIVWRHREVIKAMGKRVSRAEAVITLPGPQYSIPDLPNVRRAA